MSDSPSRPVRASDPPDDADREARIEQLLLTGLDHYFAGHYERAINVWTRVVFLERHHDRARAYIERARGAMAERLRRSEEFLHDGVRRTTPVRSRKHATCDPCPGARQRWGGRLPRAVEPGRYRRVRCRAARRRAVWAQAHHPSRRDQGRSPPWEGDGGVVAVCVAAIMLVSGLPIGTWLFESRTIDPAPVAQPASAESLPVVRPSEVMLERAKTLRADGRLREALRALDGIRVADPVRAKADRLRAEIQSDIFTAAGMSGVFSTDSNGRP